MIKMLSFLFCTCFSTTVLAHGADGFVRLSGADCVVKNTSHVNSLIVRVFENSAKVYAYKGPRHPIDTTKGLIASGEGQTYKMVGFPNNNTETVVVKLDEKLAEVLQRPRLILTAKIYKADSEVPIFGHLANPLGDVEDFQLQCSVSYSSTDKDYHQINTDQVKPAQHPSLCAIQYSEPRISKNWVHGCTATVIAPNTLLTAAHCHESFARRETRVRCGADPTWRNIMEWTANPARRPQDHPVSNPHDIAVIKLDSTGPAPAVLIESRTPETERLILENRNCRHYGMGNRQDGSVGALYVSAYRFPPELLGGRSYVEKILSWTHMIAGDPTYFVRSGDSGGPLICENAQGEDVIVGVHSFISAASSSSFSAMPSRSWDFLMPFLTDSL